VYVTTLYPNKGELFNALYTIIKTTLQTMLNSLHVFTRVLSSSKFMMFYFVPFLRVRKCLLTLQPPTPKQYVVSTVKLLLG